MPYTDPVDWPQVGRGAGRGAGDSEAEETRMLERQPRLARERQQVTCGWVEAQFCHCRNALY